jgi:transcriptional regulator with XRE-family HTH domain
MDGVDADEVLDDPGLQLRARRRAQEISQRHLAELSGVDQSVISRLEKGGDARWFTWKRLFAALGFDIVLRADDGCEEADEFIQDGIRERKERMEEGRMARW